MKFLEFDTQKKNIITDPIRLIAVNDKKVINEVKSFFLGARAKEVLIKKIVKRAYKIKECIRVIILAKGFGIMPPAKAALINQQDNSGILTTPGM